MDKIYAETDIVWHGWHRWFAWRPVFLPECGWVWLKTIDRQFSSKWWPSGQTWVADYRLARPRAADKTETETE